MKKYILFLLLILLFICTGCSGNKYPDLPDKNTPDNKDDPEIVDPQPQDDFYKYTHSKVLMIDLSNNHIELLNVTATKITDNTIVTILNENHEKKSGSFDDLYIGMDNIYVKSKNDQEILEILIDGEPSLNNIRVAIRNSINDISDSKTLYHDKVSIFTETKTKVITYDGSEEYIIPGNSSLEIYANKDNIIFYVNKVLVKTNKRIIIKGVNTELYVLGINRGSACRYSGDLEVMNINGRLLLINDLSMEDYLIKVVPSEMPASWDSEALKAQAIAARTYAYREVYNKKFNNLGYVVDDSTSSQVYNNTNPKDSSTEAVLATKGQTMFNNNEPIIAYYYSCGCGLKASGNEVWITDKVIENIPYLEGGNVSNTVVDTSSEEDMLQFFKNLKIVAPSIESGKFRWLIPMTKAQIRNTLNHNLPLMIPGNEECYKVYNNGKWEKGSFPEDVGEVLDVRVSERGKSGVVVSLEINCQNIRFRIYNQFNIRFTLRPKDCGSSVNGFSSTGDRYTYLNSFNNPSILPSGFFALEWEEDTLNIYGGGNGHGVGMDQYGAQYLAKNGKTHMEILKLYYSNIEFKDTSKEYIILDDFMKYFN